MGYILATLLSYLLVYKYIALFVAIYFTGLILPLPSNSLLMAAGAFAFQGYYFDITTSFFVALVANVLGDLTGFMITRVWGYRIIKRSYLEKFSSFKKVEKYMENHSAITIMATRFIGTPGSIVNFLSGLVGISPKRFILFDIIGNAVDTGLFLGLGYFIGTFAESASDVTTIIGWMFFILIVAFVIVKSLWRKKKEMKEIAD